MANPDFKNLNHLQNLGRFLLTAPCMLPGIMYTTIKEINNKKGGDRKSADQKWTEGVDQYVVKITCHRYVSMIEYPGRYVQVEVRQ